MLSVVIPALNAAATLPAAIGSVREWPNCEILVVDGGSADRTPELARRLGANVVAAPRGRGIQLAAGAVAARGEWLLFLHADTSLEPGWTRVAQDFTRSTKDRAGYFQFRLDDSGAAARRIERIVAWRSRALGLPYGDQGLLLPTSFYRALGGYRALPLMEDVDLVRRIGRRRLVALAASAVTSAARYRRDGWLLRPARNLVCLGLYFAGLPPRVIARLYA